jgi:hypothetical protein
MRAAIEAAILDYFEGWYTGDPERVGRALHPDLVKRSVGQDRDRTPSLATITRDQMIDATTRAIGRRRAGLATGRPRVEIDDISAGIASVRVYDEHYVEFVHLVETADGWKIANAAWRYADGHGPAR